MVTLYFIFSHEQSWINCMLYDSFHFIFLPLKLNLIVISFNRVYLMYKSLLKKQSVPFYSNKTVWKRHNKSIALQIAFYLVTIVQAFIEFFHKRNHTIPESLKCPPTKLYLVLVKKSLINLALVVLIFIGYFIIIPIFIVKYIRDGYTRILSKSSLKKNKLLINMTLRLISYATIVISVWLIFAIGWLVAFVRYPNLNLQSFEQIKDPFIESRLLKTIDYVLFYMDPFIILSINKIIRRGVWCQAFCFKCK